MDDLSFLSLYVLNKYEQIPQKNPYERMTPKLMIPTSSDDDNGDHLLIFFSLLEGSIRRGNEEGMKMVTEDKRILSKHKRTRVTNSHFLYVIHIEVYHKTCM